MWLYKALSKIEEPSGMDVRLSSCRHVAHWGQALAMYSYNMKAKSLITTAMLFALGGMAFDSATRKEIIHRDSGICQCPGCIGVFIEKIPRSWSAGWHVQAAHFPELHQRQVDFNPSHGRILCTHCHIVEEIERDNFGGHDCS